MSEPETSDNSEIPVDPALQMEHEGRLLALHRASDEDGPFADSTLAVARCVDEANAAGIPSVGSTIVVVGDSMVQVTRIRNVDMDTLERIAAEFIASLVVGRSGGVQSMFVGHVMANALEILAGGGDGKGQMD